MSTRWFGALVAIMFARFIPSTVAGCSVGVKAGLVMAFASVLVAIKTTVELKK